MPSTSAFKPKRYGWRYPWKEWLYSSEFRLVRGVHYECTTMAMINMVRQAAKKFELGTVHIHVEDDERSITVTIPAANHKRTKKKKGK